MTRAEREGRGARRSNLQRSEESEQMMGGRGGAFAGSDGSDVDSDAGNGGDEVSEPTLVYRSTVPEAIPQPTHETLLPLLVCPRPFLLSACVPACCCCRSRTTTRRSMAPRSLVTRRAAPATASSEEPAVLCLVLWVVPADLLAIPLPLLRSPLFTVLTCRNRTRSAQWWEPALEGQRALRTQSLGRISRKTYSRGGVGV